MPLMIQQNVRIFQISDIFVTYSIASSAAAIGVVAYFNHKSITQRKTAPKHTLLHLIRKWEVT